MAISLFDRIRNKRDLTSDSLNPRASTPVVPNDVWARALGKQEYVDEAEPSSGIDELMSSVQSYPDDRDLYAENKFTAEDLFGGQSKRSSKPIEQKEVTIFGNAPEKKTEAKKPTAPVKKKALPIPESPVGKKAIPSSIAEKKPQTYGLGVEKDKFTDFDSPEAKKKEPAFNLSKPPENKTVGKPGTSTQVANSFDEITEKKSSSTTDYKQANFDEHAKGLEAARSEIDETQAAQKRAEAKHPWLGSPATQAEEKQKYVAQKEADLKGEISKYTEHLSANQRKAFWEKIIHAFGKIAAGVTGLATDSDVAAHYNPESVIDKEGLDRQAVAEFQSNRDLITGKYDELLKTMNAEIEQYGKISDKSKALLDLYKAMLSEKSGTKTTEAAEEQRKHGWMEIINNPPPRRDDGKEPVQYSLDFTEFSNAVTDLGANINRYGNTLIKIFDPVEFAKQADSLLNKDSFGNKTGKYYISEKAILERYYEIRKNYPEGGQGSEQARIHILRELKQMTTPGFLDSLAGSKTEAYKLAARYGIPVQLIKTRKGLPTESFLSQMDGVNASAAPAAIPNKKAASAQPSGKGLRTVTGTKVNPKTGKEEPFKSTGNFSEADIAKFKNRGWKVSP